MQTHITWSIEKGDTCPSCGGDTVLIIAPSWWDVAEACGEGEVELSEEITGHYCLTCQKLISLSLNTNV